MPWRPRPTPRIGIAPSGRKWPFTPPARAISSTPTPAPAAEERADGDGELDVSGAREPSHRASVRPALDALELVDDLAGANLRGAGERPGRERGGEGVHRAETGLERPGDLAGQVHDVAEALRLHQPLDLDRADPRHAADVVAAQVHQHGVLG